MLTYTESYKTYIIRNVRTLDDPAILQEPRDLLDFLDPPQ